MREIIERKHISREMLRAEPGTLFVFGDNMERRGLGGQAKEMRGERNAVGIPTKWSPQRDPAAFFTDADMRRVRPVIDMAFERLQRHRGPIVWPLDGIGTGLADLPNRAPRIFEYIQSRRRALEASDAG